MRKHGSEKTRTLACFTKWQCSIFFHLGNCSAISKLCLKNKTDYICFFKQEHNHSSNNVMGRVKRLLLVYLGLLIIQLVHAVYPPLLKRFAQDHNANPLVFCFYRSFGGTLVIFSFAYLSDGICSCPSLRYQLFCLALHR